MNILILNASPRRKGNISAMLGAMEEEAVRHCKQHTCSRPASKSLYRMHDLPFATSLCIAGG